MASNLGSEKKEELWTTNGYNDKNLPVNFTLLLHARIAINYSY